MCLLNNFRIPKRVAYGRIKKTVIEIVIAVSTYLKGKY